MGLETDRKTPHLGEEAGGARPLTRTQHIGDEEREKHVGPGFRERPFDRKDRRPNTRKSVRKTGRQKLNRPPDKRSGRNRKERKRLTCRRGEKRKEEIRDYDDLRAEKWRKESSPAILDYFSSQKRLKSLQGLRSYIYKEKKSSVKKAQHQGAPGEER